MIKYQVRSKELIDIVNEIKNKRLIMSPYFQRNLVWRQLHKVDFIKTILLGYPFPQIFIAKGEIDLEKMTTTSCIVDGQQRMSSIVEYLKDQLKVDGKYYSQLEPEIKEEFLKYQVPIIDLDINSDSEQITEIFKRLNRTFYSLSTIERLSTEYASSEFMLTAKLICKELVFEDEMVNEESEDYLPLQIDPNIPTSFIDWAKQKDLNNFNFILTELDVFSVYELTRQVHLLFTLNCMSTYLDEYYTRNEIAFRHLETFAEVFDKKDEIINIFEWVGTYIHDMKITPKSYWLNKANFFSIVTLFARNKSIIEQFSPEDTYAKLIELEGELTEEYKIAAKEGVNNKKERLTRQKILAEKLLNS